MLHAVNPLAQFLERESMSYAMAQLKSDNRYRSNDRRLSELLYAAFNSRYHAFLTAWQFAYIEWKQAHHSDEPPYQQLEPSYEQVADHIAKDPRLLRVACMSHVRVPGHRNKRPCRGMPPPSLSTLSGSKIRKKPRTRRKSYAVVRTMPRTRSSSPRIPSFKRRLEVAVAVQREHHVRWLKVTAPDGSSYEFIDSDEPTLDDDEPNDFDVKPPKGTKQ
jgi:hypothetical protein